MQQIKNLRWMGSSRVDLKALPPLVQDTIGYNLYQAQLGKFPYHAKPFKGLRGLFEIVYDSDKCIYRAVYATKLDDKIYVLHIFKKKSTKGIKMPRPDIELIRTRLQMAKQIARGDL